MGYQANWGDVLKKTAVEIVESTIVTKLRSNEYVDTVANFLGGGYQGGGINGEEGREWIFEDLPNGEVNLVGIRKYQTIGGERPLQSSTEIEFDQQGLARKYRTGESGKIAFPNTMAEQLGLHYLMTGGGFFGKRGGPVDYKGIDITRTREIARDMALDYYTGKGKSSERKPIGPSPQGRNLFTVQIPVSDNLFKIINPSSYDMGLSLKYGKTGVFFEVLDPFFRGLRSSINRLGLGENAISTLFDTHLKAAKNIAGSGAGNAAYLLYPAITAAYFGQKFILDGWNFEEMGIDISPKARRN
jgi:hypothetical protein